MKVLMGTTQFKMTPDKEFVERLEALAKRTGRRSPQALAEEIIEIYLPVWTAVHDATQRAISHQALKAAEIDDFNLDEKISQGLGPDMIMSEWFHFEGKEIPDYGSLSFGGWETFSPAKKRDAITDMKRHLDRALAEMPKRKAPVVARIEPGGMTRAEIRKTLEAVPPTRKRKAR